MIDKPPKRMIQAQDTIADTSAVPKSGKEFAGLFLVSLIVIGCVTALLQIYSTTIFYESKTCSSSSLTFAYFNCTNPQIGTNGYARLTLSSGTYYYSGGQNIGIACTQSASPPSADKFTRLGLFYRSVANLTLQCYDANGAAIASLQAGKPFVANLYVNYTPYYQPSFPRVALLGNITVRVSSSTVQNIPAPPTITTTYTTTYPYTTYYTTAPATTTIPVRAINPQNPTGNSANYSSCDRFIISTLNHSAPIKRICIWKGGYLAIAAGSGNVSESVFFNFSSSNGKISLGSGTSSACLSALQSGTYMPQGNYMLAVSFRNTGGFPSSQPTCGAAVVQVFANAVPTVYAVASDPADSYVRVWSLFIDKYPGSYIGNGMYANSTNYTEYARSGYAIFAYGMNLTGVHTAYFVVSQTDGSPYGTYNGIIYVNNLAKQFSGVNGDHAFMLRLWNGTITNSSLVLLR